METDCSKISFAETGSFSKLVTDYIDQTPEIRPFYKHTVDESGFLAAIEARKQFATPRKVLQQVLRQQYKDLPDNEKALQQVDRLESENTFTVITAHQPNLFTGPLYFLYKIIHAIRMADDFNEKWPQHYFIPVYYMGSEDADLDELNHFYIHGEKRVWATEQTGAVGRMNTKEIKPLIEALSGEFSLLPHGKEIISMLKKAYLEQPDIQSATLHLVHGLFARFGLLIVIADHPALKACFIPVMKQELLTQYSSKTIASTLDSLNALYKVQAPGREINLFYLFEDGRRERIEQISDDYRVLFSDLRFTQAEMISELEKHPEKFSPNVILRGAYQETILPNIAFVGGGAELAYWMELKALFAGLAIPYPVLVIRNSFLLMNPKAQSLSDKLSVHGPDLFFNLQEQQNLLITRSYGQLPDTEEAQKEVFAIYTGLQEKLLKIDPTLQTHAAALHAKTLKGLKELTKKMQRAERRKIEDETRQLEHLKALIFPNDNLQERVENMIPFYAFYGPDFLDMLYKNSGAFDQRFAIINLKN